MKRAKTRKPVVSSGAPVGFDDFTTTKKRTTKRAAAKAKKRRRRMADDGTEIAFNGRDGDKIGGSE